MTTTGADVRRRTYLLCYTLTQPNDNNGSGRQTKDLLTLLHSHTTKRQQRKRTSDEVLTYFATLPHNQTTTTGGGRQTKDLLTLLHSHTTKRQQREPTSDEGLTYFATLPHNQTTTTGADARRRTYLLCYTPTQPNDNNGRRTSDEGLTYFATLPHNQTTTTGADARRRTYLLCYTPTQPNENNGSGRQTKDLLTLLHSHTAKWQQRERTSDEGLTYVASLPHNQTITTGADVRRRTYLICYTPTQPNNNNGSGRQT